MSLLMAQPPADVPGSQADWPLYRSIVALDLEKSTSRTDPVKRVLRDRMYDLLTGALQRTGIESHHLERLTDRGDGVLALVRPADEVPKTLLLDPFVPTLLALLADHNASVAESAELRMRLRVVLHAGDVHDDGRGFFGEELDVAFRLLDAPPVKRALVSSAGSLVLAVSDEIFQTIIKHRYGAIDADSYTQCFHVKVAGRRRYGRIHLS